MATYSSSNGGQPLYYTESAFAPIRNTDGKFIQLSTNLYNTLR